MGIQAISIKSGQIIIVLFFILIINSIHQIQSNSWMKKALKILLIVLIFINKELKKWSKTDYKY